MKKLLLTGILAAALFTNTASACGFFGLFCTDPPQVQNKVAISVQFVPTFESVNVVVRTTRGDIVAQANDTYFATESTAQTVAKKFGALRVEYRESIQNLGGNYLYASGDLKGSPAIVRVLIFGKGTLLQNNVGLSAGVTTQDFEINAGVLADYYRRMPEKEFPAYVQIFGNPPVETHYLSLAEQYVWRVLVSLGTPIPLFPPTDTRTVL